MTTQKNHPAAGQPDSFDRYPGYYGSDLELTYTPQRSVFTLWAPAADKVAVRIAVRFATALSDSGAWGAAVIPMPDSSTVIPCRSGNRF